MAALIAAQRDEHRIPHTVGCRALGVSRSWFYRWKDGTLTPRAARKEALAAEVIAAGPAGIAVMGGVMRAIEPAREVRGLLSVLAQAARTSQ